MAKSNGPKGVSRPTLKRLFAVSGNKCAFHECSAPLVDPQSGSIIGEVCHIKGERPGAARHDPQQSAADRHGFGNLLLLCNIHHKIVDENSETYTIDRLLELKRAHEAAHPKAPSIDPTKIGQFINATITGSRIQGPLILSQGQTGGQTAHSIYNHYYVSGPPEEAVRIEGKLEFCANERIMAKIGCPGMQFTVICRSRRFAKISSAHLLVRGVGAMKPLQQAFESNLGYEPLEGSKETLDFHLIPLTLPHVDEGFVLQRDDVARFFYPLPVPATPLALRAEASDVSITVEYFDGSEETVLSGSAVQNCLKNLFKVYRTRHGKMNVDFTMSVRVLSKHLGTAEKFGEFNSRPLWFTDPTDDSWLKESDI